MLTFINAIASFPAEPHNAAAASNPPTTAATTVAPQAPLANNISSPPRIRGHSCDFGSPVHDRLIYAEAMSPSGQERLCSSVQLCRGYHVRRTPRFQARGLFRCTSVGGSQRTHLWQCGCDLCLASSSTLGPCRHQGKSASVPAFNCFEVTAFGEPPDCRLLGFSGVLALAAASARIYDSVVAALAPTESPISMKLTNTVVKRYAGYCVLTWA